MLTTLNCLALARSSCCSTASACCVLWTSRVAPIGCEAGGGDEDWSQPRRMEARVANTGGNLSEDSEVLYTASPTPRLITEVTRLLAELAVSWRPSR